ICAAMREGSRVTSGPRIAWKPYAETRVNMAEPRPTRVWVRNPALFNRRERSTPIATESTKARARSSSSVSQDSGNKTMSIIGIRRPPSAHRGRRPPGALQNYPLIRGCHVRRPANGRGSRCSDGGSATGEQTDRSARGKLAGMSSAPATASAPVNPRSRVVVASLIGTTIEFYDFYVYATAAVLVFPHLFFPAGDETTALLSSFAVFGAAMVARPLGAVFFGHLGDKVGRKTTLVAALLTMGIATFLIGVLPTYLVIGWFAPLLLVILRLAQGFALGGEWSGAALVATENAPKGKRAWYGTFPQLGAPIGFIIANGLFLIIAFALPSDDPSRPSDAFLDWGWRIPFLFSAVMVIVGLWVRLKLVESDAFTNTVKSGKVVKLPLKLVFKSNWRELILGTFFMLATYVLFYLMTTFSLSYGRAPIEPAEGQQPGLGYNYNTFVLMLIAGVVFFGIFTLLSGPWADKFGRRKTLIIVTAGIIMFGLLWVPLLGA